MIYKFLRHDHGREEVGGDSLIISRGSQAGSLASVTLQTAMILLFEDGKTLGSEELSNLLRATQPVRGRAGI